LFVAVSSTTAVDVGQKPRRRRLVGVSANSVPPNTQFTSTQSNLTASFAFRRVYNRWQSQLPRRYDVTTALFSCMHFSKRVEPPLSSSALHFLHFNCSVSSTLSYLHIDCPVYSRSLFTTLDNFALPTAHSDGHGFPPRIFRRRFTCGCLVTSPAVLINIYVA
jgi:hypothetical protein